MSEVSEPYTITVMAAKIHIGLTHTYFEKHTYIGILSINILMSLVYAN